MTQAKLSVDLMKEAIAAVEAAGGNQSRAAIALGISRTTLQGRLHTAAVHTKTIGLDVDPESAPYLKSHIKRLEVRLAEAEKKRLDHEMIKRRIIGLTQNVETIDPPEWVVANPNKTTSPGVPTLLVSDLHWGEVVDPTQINGVNKYDLEIAHRRLERLAERAIRLLGIISPTFDYPGIVMPLAGDMVSGNIHDELVATNELSSVPAVLDLFEALGSLIKTLLQRFDRIFIPCVTGNHGRDTKKIWSKDRHTTSFDWLLYCFLAKHFAEDKRVTFLIPNGSDAYYKVFDHRYLLTHLDQFRGGDSMIGALGPIIRGDHKKRSRNSQIDMPYDTMIGGHWHQYIHLNRLIVNSSLKGYDEYAFQGNFPYEIPQQALWLNHPKHGITYRMPVQVDTLPGKKSLPWVSVK